MQMVMILTAPPQGLIPLLPTMQIVLILPIYIYIYIYIKPKWWEYPNIKSVVWMESVLSDIFPFVLDDLPAS